ncbi:30S ribosomal protein S18 [Candidatus Tisiphia endosymbiont of Ptychoptera albimana]|uniref:30S ribosomal protein S18 n=1 Tax=Candidatus Tisiphia endosymbiont of Ptychoptera albimana TaxID=3066260 RepID=UPI001D7A6BE4|nr:30S ribosomal protein S18 [Rickettsia endosymbiont of Sericostoma sp. HW-2014]
MFENDATDSKSMTRMADRTNKRVFFRKRKGCPLSIANAPIIDYKNPDLLIKFVSGGGRMLPSRITNVCAKKQRKLKNAIKIARILALLPFVFQV